jgi:hypothetical protein
MTRHAGVATASSPAAFGRTDAARAWSARSSGDIGRKSRCGSRLNGPVSRDAKVEVVQIGRNSNRAVSAGSTGDAHGSTMLERSRATGDSCGSARTQKGYGTITLTNPPPKVTCSFDRRS